MADTVGGASTITPGYGKPWGGLKSCMAAQPTRPSGLASASSTTMQNSPGAIGTALTRGAGLKS